jgi:hypothetical protein
MRKYLDRFEKIRRVATQEKGEFVLFALFLRENANFDRWDLVVSAPWIQEDFGGALGYLADKIKEEAGVEVLHRLARIAPINPDALPPGDEMWAGAVAGMTPGELRYFDFLEQRVSHAFVLAAPNFTHAETTA